MSEDITTRQLAKEIHVSPQLLNFVETGRQPATEQFVAKLLAGRFSQELGLIASMANNDQSLQKTLLFERIVYSLPAPARTAAAINAFKAAVDLAMDCTPPGARISESRHRDGLVVYLPALAWFFGSNLHQVVTGSDFVAFYPASPLRLSTSQLLDLLLYLFHDVRYDLRTGNITCSNGGKAYSFAHNLLAYRLETDLHSETVEDLFSFMSAKPVQPEEGRTAGPVNRIFLEGGSGAFPHG